MGRGRSAAFFFGLFVGLISVSFTVEGTCEVAAGGFGWTDTKALLNSSASPHISAILHKFRCVHPPAVREDCPSEV